MGTPVQWARQHRLSPAATGAETADRPRPGSRRYPPTYRYGSVAATKARVTGGGA